jgi:hypothetical protein
MAGLLVEKVRKKSFLVCRDYEQCVNGGNRVKIE